MKCLPLYNEIHFLIKDKEILDKEELHHNKCNCIILIIINYFANSKTSCFTFY